jgi:hypothetical protein
MADDLNQEEGNSRFDDPQRSLPTNLRRVRANHFSSNDTVLDVNDCLRDMDRIVYNIVTVIVILLLGGRPRISF